jgi:ABC-2 type transport system ATP-binding protein
MQGREQTKANTYSRGMVQRFGLGAALIGNPKLLILDEPTAGLIRNVSSIKFKIHRHKTDRSTK